MIIDALILKFYKFLSKISLKEATIRQVCKLASIGITEVRCLATTS